ncbi:probable G-protein coupled receptor Mth-like 14 [Chironomus tepperi]|uniref:probable G-protein coupled receptor Mth-like 14 n=1 Tax=Chironomus tepperi TaxID=113505 RepID=UPI00391F3EE1
MISLRVTVGVVLIFLEVCTFGVTEENASSINNATTTVMKNSSIFDGSTKSLEVDSTTITTTTTISMTTSTLPTNFQVPENCSDYKLLDNQPKVTSRSAIKKCCPLHQNYKIEMGKRFCGNSSLEFNVNPIRAKFYENCIEDEESDVTIDIKIENSCKNGLIFNKNYNDMLYVIQNGSLLRIDENFESFDIFEHYCLDMDEDEQILTAIVCEFDEAIFRVNRAQALIFATCMIISVPCLLLTVTLYLLVPELNDLHGKSLACHSISLALGFLLLAISQFRDDVFFLEGYVIQFCIVSCFFWLTVMWIDICIHAWYYLPRGIKQTTKDDNLHLMYYSIFAFGLPLILVILTYKNKLSGLPSYYLKGTTEVARTSQTFFIPPISATLFLNILLYISSYFGFKKLQKINISNFLMLQLKKCARDSKLSSQNVAHMEKVETIMKSTAYLTLIMTVNWIFEIISFYNETSSTLFDIINALQGLLIFFIFVCLPRPMKLIKHWWKDRGSFEVISQKPLNEIQMTSLKQ